MSRYPALAIFILILLAIALVLIVVIPLWKRERSQQFYDNINYVGFMRRFLAFVIDGCIWAFILYLIRMTQIEMILITQWQHIVMSELLKAILAYSIVTFFVVKYGGTPGKMLMKIKIISIHGGNISIKNAIFRQIPAMILKMVNIAQIYSLVSAFVVISMIVNFGDYSNAYDFRGDIWLTVLTVFSAIALCLADYLVIFTNKRKRAIHDFLAGSIVVPRNFNPEINNADDKNANKSDNGDEPTDNPNSLIN